MHNIYKLVYSSSLVIAQSVPSWNEVFSLKSDRKALLMMYQVYLHPFCGLIQDDTLRPLPSWITFEGKLILFVWVALHVQMATSSPAGSSSICKRNYPSFFSFLFFFYRQACYRINTEHCHWLSSQQSRCSSASVILTCSTWTPLLARLTVKRS